MECAQTVWPSDQEYLHQFKHKVTSQRIPLSGSIDLTHRCNFRCVHCYLGAQKAISEKRDQELSAQQWIAILDEITQAGCLYLLITGGDPLLRKDFPQIYRHAKLNGLLVTIFTNGSLITEELLQLFEDLPPRNIEISLYGASNATYEKITGIKGAYSRCIAGIERLLAVGVRIKLKTVLMTLNNHEFYEIVQIAEKYGVDFRFDAMIFPKFDGDKSPVQLRIPPAEVVEKELFVEDGKSRWLKFLQSMPSQSSSTDALYTCGTGLSSFHINAYGMLQSCIMVTSVQYNLLQGDFITGWQESIPRVRKKKITHSEYRCKQCNKMSLCGYCPAFFALETDSEELASEYLYSLGEERFNQIHL